MADFAWNDHYSWCAPLSRWLARHFIADWAELTGEAELKWKEKYILGTPPSEADLKLEEELNLKLGLDLKPEAKAKLKVLDAEMRRDYCLEELEKQSEKYLIQLGVSDKSWKGCYGGYEDSLAYAVAQSADMEEVQMIIRGTIDKDY